jgi:hypothetical protein
MVGRTFCTLILVLPLLGFVSGCDSRPKIVMPTQKAPPAPRPHVAGPGGPVVEAPAPAADPDEKQADSKKSLPEDKE